MKDKAWSVPDKRGIKDNLEPEVEERTILKTWNGDIIDITDDLKKLIEKLELEKKENRGLRGLFKKIRNKVSKMANDAQKKRKPDERVFLYAGDGEAVDITEEIEEMATGEKKK